LFFALTSIEKFCQRDKFTKICDLLIPNLTYLKKKFQLLKGLKAYIEATPASPRVLMILNLYFSFSHVNPVSIGQQYSLIAVLQLRVPNPHGSEFSLSSASGFR
jgi:hypothetical protein